MLIISVHDQPTRLSKREAHICSQARLKVLTIAHICAETHQVMKNRCAVATMALNVGQIQFCRNSRRGCALARFLGLGVLGCCWQGRLVPSCGQPSRSGTIACAFRPKALPSCVPAATTAVGGLCTAGEGSAVWGMGGCWGAQCCLLPGSMPFAASAPLVGHAAWHASGVGCPAGAAAGTRGEDAGSTSPEAAGADVDACAEAAVAPRISSRLEAGLCSAPPSGSEELLGTGDALTLLCTHMCICQHMQAWLSSNDDVASRSSKGQRSCQRRSSFQHTTFGSAAAKTHILFISTADLQCKHRQLGSDLLWEWPGGIPRGISGDAFSGAAARSGCLLGRDNTAQTDAGNLLAIEVPAGADSCSCTAQGGAELDTLEGPPQWAAPESLWKHTHCWVDDMQHCKIGPWCLQQRP